MRYLEHCRETGWLRVRFNPQQSTDRQEPDFLAVGVRRDDLYVDQGVSSARTLRPHFDRALEALEHGDTLIITTFDCLGRSTQNMASANELARLVFVPGDDVRSVIGSVPEGSEAVSIDIACDATDTSVGVTNDLT